MKDKKKRKIEESVTVDSETLAKYSRGNDKPINPNRKFKALKKTLESFKKSNFEAANLTATTEILLPQDAGTIEFHNEKNEYDSKIYRLKQADILKNVDLNTSAKAFDLHLTHFGPYTVKYSRNGRLLLINSVSFDIHIMNYGIGKAY
jgi:U3 small nucleolar RNA-associated protein 7